MTVLDAIADKKNRLDRLRPLSPEALSKLEHYYDVEITYASNAIEGNTLSPVETTLVIEQGLLLATNRSKITLKPSITTTPSAMSASWPAKRHRRPKATHAIFIGLLSSDHGPTSPGATPTWHATFAPRQTAMNFHLRPRSRPAWGTLRNGSERLRIRRKPRLQHIGVW
jgi:hypothetical protein